MEKKVLGLNKGVRDLILAPSLLIVFCFAFGPGFNSKVNGATENLIASHDSSSPQYNKDCTSCHANLITEKTLVPSITSAHLAMLPFAPGKTNNKCIWCHRSVDLTQGATPSGKASGNLRKRVDVTLCTLCHGPEGPGNQFYNVGPSSANLDGAALYELVCAACHGSLPNSKVKGESATEIGKKIEKNEGGMGPLIVLTTEQIEAIAQALAQ